MLTVDVGKPLTAKALFKSNCNPSMGTGKKTLCFLVNSLFLAGKCKNSLHFLSRPVFPKLLNLYKSITKRRIPLTVRFIEKSTGALTIKMES
jgi:hypothetical protein